MAQFKLDAEQADAILELRSIASLSGSWVVRRAGDAGAADQRAAQGEENRWARTVRLEQISSAYGDKRRTAIASTQRARNAAEDFIVGKDNVVIVLRDGWVKRQKEVKDLSTTRLREGDQVMAVCAGSTRASVVFFSNFGAAYTSKIIDVPASTGYGEPIQKQFKLKDGEKLVAALSLDPRVASNITAKGKAIQRRCAVAAYVGYARAGLRSWWPSPRRAPPPARRRRRDRQRRQTHGRRSPQLQQRRAGHPVQGR
jgi:DNA gyrase subunit A